jgi:hypothetical protein
MSWEVINGLWLCRHPHDARFVGLASGTSEGNHPVGSVYFEGQFVYGDHLDKKIGTHSPDHLKLVERMVHHEFEGELLRQAHRTRKRLALIEEAQALIRVHDDPEAIRPAIAQAESFEVRLARQWLRDIHEYPVGCIPVAVTSAEDEDDEAGP